MLVEARVFTWATYVSFLPGHKHQLFVIVFTAMHSSVRQKNCPPITKKDSSSPSAHSCASAEATHSCSYSSIEALNGDPPSPMTSPSAPPSPRTRFQQPSLCWASAMMLAGMFKMTLGKGSIRNPYAYYCGEYFISNAKH